MPSKLATFLCALIQAATQTAGTMLPTPTHNAAAASPLTSPPTTAMPSHSGWKDWLRAATSEEPNTINVCGFSGFRSLTCEDTTRACTNTILSDGRAYQYCSNSLYVTQYVFTAVNDYYSGWSYASINSDMLYCTDSISPHGITELFTSDGVTATGFGCSFYNVSGVNTWHAYSKMLNPVEYSSELEAWRESQAPTTTSTPPTSYPPHTPTVSHTPTPPPNKNSGGLSTGAKIGIGVGVGIGVLGLLIAATALLLARRKTRNSAQASQGPPSYYREPEKLSMGSPQSQYQQPAYPQFQQQQPSYQPSTSQYPQSPRSELPSY